MNQVYELYPITIFTQILESPVKNYWMVSLSEFDRDKNLVYKKSNLLLFVPHISIVLKLMVAFVFFMNFVQAVQSLHGMIAYLISLCQRS